MDEFRKKARTLDPIIWIGKNGITQGLINELKKLLKKKKFVKVKMLRNFVEENDKKKVPIELAEKTSSKIIDQVGFTFVLHKR